MSSLINAFNLILRFNDILRNEETATIKIIAEALAKSYVNLDRELRRSYHKYNQLDLTSVQRATLLNSEIESMLNLLPKPVIDSLEQPVVNLIQLATNNSNSLAQSLIRTLNPESIIIPSTVPIEAVKNSANNAMLWLSGTNTEFKITAKKVIAQGLAQNKGVAWTTSVLRQNLGISQKNAETIIRTATLQATDESTKEVYESNNIGYAQRVSAEDKNVCGICSLRAGNIYKLNETSGILHNRCRCYLMPILPEWIKTGLVDLEWTIQHHEQTLAIASSPPNYGIAQFERQLGFPSPPQPVWTPRGGFLDEEFANRSN
jgi:SPP1 gp7 family putative phage head morphogenesis protein